MLFSNHFSGSKILLIPRQKITPNPHQTRRWFDPEELASLAESIRVNGILQPLTVRKLGGDRYELIAGERRWRAAELAGLEKVPCILCAVGEEDSAVLCLLENLQRQDLNCFEEAEGIALLIEQYHLTQKQVAERLGKQQSTIANKLRLLRLPLGQRQRMADAGLSERHARALLLLEEDALRAKVLEEVIGRNYTVAQTEQRVEMLLAGSRPKPKKPIVIVKDVRIFLNTLSHAVDVMKHSGLQVTEVKNETEEFLEYTVRIENSRQKKRHSA